LIGELAFDELTPDLQATAIELLRSHPRFADDFAIPEKAGDPEHWLIGRAAYWPDVARSQKEYNRPAWHYQLGAVLVLNDAKYPDSPGPAPEDATLATQDLHIVQAIELCRSVLRDKTRAASDRAIAFCWIAHLIGDAHQPSHAGSLYSKRFPEGDREGNSIPTLQSKNMHALWDGLLGSKYDAGDIKRRSNQIRSNEVGVWKIAGQRTKLPMGVDPMSWLRESQSAAIKSVYTPEVMEPISALPTDEKLEPIDLSELYLQNAGMVARQRAAFAAQRLAEVLRQDLAD